IRNEKRLERDMIAVKIGGDLRYAVVASPEYLAHRPRPQAPQDLQQHNCIRFRLGNGSILPWMFHIDGADTEVEVNGSLIVNNPDLARRAVDDGVGLLYAPYDYVLKPLAQKQLVQVLDNWMPEQADGFFLYYPSRRQ